MSPINSTPFFEILVVNHGTINIIMTKNIEALIMATPMKMGEYPDPSIWLLNNGVLNDITI